MCSCVKFHRTGTPLCPPSGEQAFHFELVRRRVCGRVFRALTKYKGEHVQRAGGLGDFWGGVATKQAQHFYAEMGVYLEGERTWRSGAG